MDFYPVLLNEMCARPSAARPWDRVSRRSRSLSFAAFCSRRPGGYIRYAMGSIAFGKLEHNDPIARLRKRR